MDISLDAMDQRILGALLEKQRTVPASYPMSVNALQSACNQRNSREPVTDYEAGELERRLRELKDRGLVRVVVPGAGSRTLKFHQLLEEGLGLSEPEVALLAVLLLRGAQTAGELRSRTGRLHTFADRDAVEATLTEMAADHRGLVHELAPRPGQHDSRWIHLLGDTAATDSLTEPTGPDREQVLADGSEVRDERVRRAYDTVAEAYATAMLHELDDKPFDRWLLERVARIAAGRPVADVGTGPGQVAVYLADLGLDVIGYDISPEMITTAKSNPGGASFEVGDLRSLMRPRTAAGWGAITGWYALCHAAPSELSGCVNGLVRLLDTGGVLALALHVGRDLIRTEELLGHAVDLDFVLHDRDEVLAALDAAGLVDLEWYARGPLASEAQTERFYVIGRKP